MKDIIRKHALKNALDHGGRANPGAVLGRVLGEDASLRSIVPEVKKEVDCIIKEIGSFSVEKIKEKLGKIDPHLLQEKKKKPKKKELELEGAKKGKVVMRFAPSPSGPLHIGHAYVLSLNAALCKKYNGKLLLRIDDTNPENISPPAYDLIPEDANWLTGNQVKQVYVQSDLMDSYYKTVEKLIDKQACYVCTCTGDEFREYSKKKEACLCRGISLKENKKRWKHMLDNKGYQEGEAVVRIKTKMDHKDPAMRDWPALRIKLASHPRQKSKFRVWPLLAFAIAVNDHEMGVTHAIRGKDQMSSDKRIAYLCEHLGWAQPTMVYVGFINFTDIRLSTTQTRKLIETGKFTGWDDVQLPTLRAMKRRGYQPEAFITYALDVGLTQNDKKVSKKEFFKTVNHFNKELIDEKSNRYFFVNDPKKITVAGAPDLKVEMELHPDFPKRAKRTFKTTTTFFIERADYEKLKDGRIHRLMDCLNFTVKKGKIEYDSQEYDIFKNAKEGLIIHWLPQNETVDVHVLMDDGTLAKGFGEIALKKLKVGDIIQFERFGFCRLDKRSKDTLVFAYGHR